MSDGLRLRGVSRVVIVVATAAALATIAWFVRDLVRDTIALPVYVAVQWMLVYVRSVPEDLYWLLLVGLGIFSAVRTIGRMRRPQSAVPPVRTSRGGGAGELLRWTSSAGRNPYYHRRLAELVGLQLCRAARVVPDRGRLLESLQDAGVAVPDYLVAYLGKQNTTGWRTRLSRYRKKYSERELELLEEALAAVEAQAGVYEQQ